MLGRRGFSLESAVARVCREAVGARGHKHLRARHGFGSLECPRQPTFRDGLLFGGVQLAVDTTLVSAIYGDGQPQRGLLTGMVWLSNKRAGAKTQRALNSCSQAAERDQWFRLWKGGRPFVIRKSEHSCSCVAEARNRSEPNFDEAAHGTGVASSLVLDPFLCSYNSRSNVSSNHPGVGIHQETCGEAARSTS